MLARSWTCNAGLQRSGMGMCTERGLRASACTWRRGGDLSRVQGGQGGNVHASAHTGEGLY